ncbi:MAG: aminotransferase class I/II-fold pyridoxal phosphate-dependent enzyme [Bacteroidetes bacterium]|nr:aminotransferase class I/II-fold pyridoxal phosphate-dependent enzyme [Bacteroidota bacterium]
MNTRILLSPPHMSGGEEQYIREAFATNWIAPLGPNVDQFEQELSRYLAGNHAAVLNSGTAAIHLALILSGVGQGDEVIVPDFTFSATVNPVIYQGAMPVIVDSEMNSWNMDPQLLEEAINDRLKKNKKPKAILVVDIYGMPASMEEIVDIAAKYDIPLIEDSAEALGSKYNGQPCSTFGEMGILSFNGNKIITTSGGGALISANPSYANRARFLASQAREDALHFEHLQVGYNYKMSNVLAGVGRSQLEVIDDRVAARRYNNQCYRRLLSTIRGLVFQSEPTEKYFSNFWLTSVIFNESDDRFNSRSVLEALRADNIDSRPLMKPMHLQPVFKEYPSYLNGVSEHLFSHGLCLPSGSGLLDQDIERICERVLSV